MSKPKMSQIDYYMATQMRGGPTLIAPQMLGRFGMSGYMAPESGNDAPEPEAFDANWRDFRGLGLSISDRVAILDITGALTFKLSWWQTGYDELTEMIRNRIVRAGAADAILLNIHSPGGVVAGCFDCADFIYETSKEIPVWALIADCGCSAAFALASQASKVFITQTAVAGSIGVVLTHEDHSQRAQQLGVNVTHIYAGANKVLGNPYEPLPQAAKNALQAEVDTIYDRFVQIAARGTGLSEEDIIATEANTYIGQEAVEIGLVDAVASPQDVLTELQRAVQSGSIETRSSAAATTTEIDMDTNSPEFSAAVAAAVAAAMPSALAAAQAEGAPVQPTAPAAEQPAAPAASEAPAEPSAADERARIQAITGHENAKGRGEAAANLAFNTSMTVEEAGALLGTLPKAAAKSNLDSAMAAYNAQEPDAEAEAEGGEPAVRRMSSAEIYEARRADASRGRDKAQVAA